MIIGVVCQEKTLGYTMHKLHIQMPRFLNESSWRPITLTEFTTHSISFQEQVLNFHTTFRNVNCLNAKLNLHFSDVFALLHCQCRDAGDSVRLQALKHGEGAAAGAWASAQGWCDQDEKQNHNRGHLTVRHGGVRVSLLSWEKLHPAAGTLVARRSGSSLGQHSGLWSHPGAELLSCVAGPRGTVGCCLLSSSHYLPVRDGETEGRGKAVH